MPGKILTISAFICERVLIEADGVVSAIRIFDSVTLLNGASGLMNIVVTIKTSDPLPGDWTARLIIQSPDGEESQLFKEPFKVYIQIQ